MLKPNRLLMLIAGLAIMMAMTFHGTQVVSMEAEMAVSGCADMSGDMSVSGGCGNENLPSMSACNSVCVSAASLPCSGPLALIEAAQGFLATASPVQIGRHSAPDPHPPKSILLS